MNPHIFAYKSAVYRFLKLPKDALTQINLAIELGLEIDPSVQYHKGVILRDLGKSEDSKAAFEESKRLLASNSGSKPLTEGELKASVVSITLDDLEMAKNRQSSPPQFTLKEVKSPEEYHGLGMQEIAAGNKDLAIAYFTESINKSTTHKNESLYRRGACYYMKGKWSQALSDLNAYAKNNKTAILKDANFYAIRGSVYSKLTRLSEAIADLNRAVKTDDKYVTTRIFCVNIIFIFVYTCIMSVHDLFISLEK